MKRFTDKLGSILQLGLARRIELREITVSLPPTHAALAGFTILHLSDLHMTPRWPPALDTIIAFARERKPDLICCTGDFVESKIDGRPALPCVAKFFEPLVTLAPCFGVLGNHDGDLIRPAMESIDVHILHGERVTLGHRGQAISLIGLPGVHRSDMQLLSTWNVDPASYRIVLSHYPDAIRKLDALSPHLLLAGHTHGGQVCLPGGIPILRHDSLPSVHTHGLSRWGEAWLHVSRGVGTSKYPVRLFCMPEVTLLTLRA